jgi:GH24 family phage-related lysozyme (muramidase)
VANVPNNIKDLLKAEEGFRSEVYLDEKGFSVGYGHKLSEDELKRYPPGTSVPQSQLDSWLEEDLESSYTAAQTQANSLSRFHELDATQRAKFLERLTSVNFQLGTSWHKDHDKTWALMQAGDFEGASVEVLDSKWFKEQTPGRAKELSDFLASLGSATGQVYGETVPGDESPDVGPLIAKVRGKDRTGTQTLRQTQPRAEDTSFLPTVSPVFQPGSSSHPFSPASELDLSGAVAAKLFQTERFEAGTVAASAPMYREDTSPTPRYTVGDIWSGSVEAGAKQLVGDVYQFGALYNLVTGDQKAAEAKLNRAERLHQEAGSILNSMGTFEEFLDQPTYEGFADQILKAVGQFTPMAFSSVASGFTGAAIAVVGKGLLTAGSKRITKEVISNILKKEVAHKKGLGEALDANEEAILKSAYETVKRMGQITNAENLVSTGVVPSNFPFVSAGFWAGAGGQEYVVGSSQALGEFKEAGYKLTAEEAWAAYGLGIPQAIIGTIGEKLFVGAMFKSMARRVAKTGDKEAAGWMKEVAKGFAGGLAKGGGTELGSELAQEELFIQQRFAIDPKYSQREANLRRAESAFAGFWAGAARSAPAGAIANVIGKTRSNVEEGADLAEDIATAVKKGTTSGRVIPEPRAWSVAQTEALLD